MSVVKKKRHVSKKNKKAWRKYCDIGDVEAFLEDQRLEERLGAFDIKPDNELFIEDKVGDTQLEDEDIKPLSAKLKKREKLAEMPKCFEILLPTSKVQDPNAKRNHVNPVGTKPTALSKVTEKRKIANGIFEKKLEVARTNRKIAFNSKKKRKQTRQNFSKDLWGEDLPEAKGIPSTLCDDFISPEAQLHNVLPDRRLRNKPPPPNTVISRAAIDTPHPGVSYNPTYQEHQELLQEVCQHELTMMKREAHLQRVTTGMFRKVTPSEKQNQWQEEMSIGLPVPHNPSNADSKHERDSESDTEYKAINAPIKNKKKDHKTRRKQRERLVEKERLKREKIDKQKISDIYKLRKLQLSITKKEQSQETLRTKRAKKRKATAALATPALNAHKVPKKEPEFVDPLSLSGDLRNISTSMNLLRDRYESLQRRGALAGAKLMMKKKRKFKSYFKAGHKVTDQDVERYTTQADGKSYKFGHK